jgi:hypothetical protein
MSGVGEAISKGAVMKQMSKNGVFLMRVADRHELDASRSSQEEFRILVQGCADIA